MNSLVSVIIPSYNHAKFLKERLKSIISQTFVDYEMIIIDDNSTDGSAEILREFYNNNKNKIKHFSINEHNSGSGYTSWKKGIHLAETPYIWIAETDDTAEPNFLNDAIQILEANADVNLVFCASNIIDENGERIKRTIKRLDALEVAKGEIGIFSKDRFLANMPFQTLITNGSSVVFRKPLGGFPDHYFKYKQMTDAFVWTHLITPGRFAFINKTNSSFRRHTQATTMGLYQKNLNLIFREKAEYLRYFELTHKHEEFLDHYVNSYLWYHKGSIFDFQIVDFLKGGLVARGLYLLRIVKIFPLKAITKIVKKLNP